MELPLYVKASIFIIGISALITTLYVIQDILIPIVFAVIIAVVLHPVVNVFIRLGINRIVAISITILLTSSIMAALCGLIVLQVSQLSDSWPVLVDRVTIVLDNAIYRISSYFDIAPDVILKWMATTKTELLNNSSSAIGQTLISVGGWIVMICLVPVYVFLLLYYHPILIEFVHKVFGALDQHKVKEIVTQTKTIIQHYLVGLVIETGIVAGLNVGGLFILGIDYAILLGVFGALLNLIPYVGGIVAVGLSMMVALATKPSAWFAVYALIMFMGIQMLDENYIKPIIVASKVKINALFSIIIVIAGNALWGISGMFLAIPLLAIVKLIFDHIDSLKMWGFLLGDTMPPILKVRPFVKKKIKT